MIMHALDYVQYFTIVQSFGSEKIGSKKIEKHASDGKVRKDRTYGRTTLQAVDALRKVGQGLDKIESFGKGSRSL